MVTQTSVEINCDIIKYYTCKQKWIFVLWKKTSQYPKFWNLNELRQKIKVWYKLFFK